MYHLTRINTSARGKRTRGPRRRKTRAPRNKNVAFLWLWEFKRNFHFATASAPIRPLLKSTSTDKKRAHSKDKKKYCRCTVAHQKFFLLLAEAIAIAIGGAEYQAARAREKSCSLYFCDWLIFFPSPSLRETGLPGFLRLSLTQTHIHRRTLALGALHSNFHFTTNFNFDVLTRVWERKGPSCPL
jgi:hypothetical protein